ncbi:hypothetical protein [uncultured Alteromonas sp.]|jgi:uncharacterized membrane protein|uniref:hypothetical protein n=1 Tax=uncultured Alteromonas sp. TaxID=179113 RepID=UPI0025EB9863|nr:hypothetical protein [uncultured Alteromonas sp.]
MKIIEQVKARIEEHRYSGSSEFLAMALASACNSQYKVSLIDASVKLDAEAKEMIWQLTNIAQQLDFSNADQSRALHWLRDNDFIK